MKKEIEQLYKPLFLYIRKRISNQLDAEDLTQEVFYKLSKSNTDDIDNIKSWIYSIAKNTIIDYYRKKKQFTEEIDEMFNDPIEMENSAFDELSSCVVLFVNQLPEAYKTIISMSELEGFSQKEIAEKLDMNYTTVRSKVQRGRQKLKGIFSDCCTITQGGKGSIIDYKRKDDYRGC